MTDIREAMTTQRRALEDIGWMRVNQAEGQFNSLIKDSYADMVKRSRLAYIKSPIVAQALNVTTWYTFGLGVSTPISQDKEVQEIITEFWEDPDNRDTMTSSCAQMLLSTKQQYDGEIAFIITLDLDGSMYVSLIDPLTINQIIKDPHNPAKALFYKRRIMGKDEYISDWRNGAYIMSDDARYSENYVNMLEMLRIKPSDVKQNAVLYHNKINSDPLDNRGIPEVYRALDWMNANAKINSDTASFINAQSQYAWNMKVKGTKNQVEKFKNRMRQNKNLTNPSMQAGSSAFTNDKFDMEPVKLASSTGALFEVGIRRTLLMCAAAFGIFEHYFGDPSTGNLATTKAMELPMLKKFEAKQKHWESIYSDILQFQLDMKLMALNTKAFELNVHKNRIKVNKSSDYKDRAIDINFPPILDQDIKAMADAMAVAKKEKLVPRETAQRIFMQSAGVNNIEEELKKEFEKPAAPAPNPFNPPTPGAPVPNPDDDDPDDDDPAQESIGGKAKGIQQSRDKIRVAETNKEMLRKVNGYLREIGGVFNIFVKESPRFIESFKNNNDKFAIRNDTDLMDKALESFIRKMHKLAIKYYPKVIELGATYANSQIGIKESASRRVREVGVEDLFDDLIDKNEKFLRTSLKPALRARMVEAALGKFDTEMEATNAIRSSMIAAERRVGMYGSALWTVGQKAVKEVAQSDPSKLAMFVGVQDEGNCAGCTEGISGNPWSIQEIPVPGNQDCLSNCRHAIQLEGDDDLTESDIKLLSDAESQSKSGYRLLENTILEKTFPNKG